MDCQCHFPEDLVVDILSRLPVESLLRFKCVCKHWYGFIKSASFKEKHFHQKNNGARLLVCDFKITKIAPIFVKSVVFSLLPKKIVPDVTPEQKVLLHLPNISDFKCVAGPVYGLFLVQEQIYNEGVRLGLWNPATREFRPLPSAPFEIEHFFSDHYHQFGLGFDLLTQYYKVVWIRDYEGHGVYPHVSVCVYSSCNNSWKNLEFPPSYTSGLPFDTTYLNGVYYWRSLRVNEMYRIHSFDMGSEQFGEMQLPVIPNEYWKKLTLRGDSLAMLAGYRSMTFIYEMKQEGSWSKVVTVQPSIDPHWPRDIWENDKIVFEIRETKQLVLYDLTTSEVTDLGIQMDRTNCVFNYKESLALIKNGDETQDQDNVVEQIEHFFSVRSTDDKSLFTIRGPPNAR
ncbi:hypothetical protein KY285_020896 [Solanum tuberosum]|nr:hypothetical protein KY285_020896 [Solanum tuberosum]